MHLINPLVRIEPFKANQNSYPRNKLYTGIMQFIIYPILSPYLFHFVVTFYTVEIQNTYCLYHQIP